MKTALHFTTFLHSFSVYSYAPCKHTHHHHSQGNLYMCITEHPTILFNSMTPSSNTVCIYRIQTDYQTTYLPHLTELTN